LLPKADKTGYIIEPYKSSYKVDPGQFDYLLIMITICCIMMMIIIIPCY